MRALLSFSVVLFFLFSLAQTSHANALGRLLRSLINRGNQFATEPVEGAETIGIFSKAIKRKPELGFSRYGIRTTALTADRSGIEGPMGALNLERFLVTGEKTYAGPDGALGLLRRFPIVAHYAGDTLVTDHVLGVLIGRGTKHQHAVLKKLGNPKISSIDQSLETTIRLIRHYVEHTETLLGKPHKPDNGAIAHALAVARSRTLPRVAINIADRESLARFLGLIEYLDQYLESYHEAHQWMRRHPLADVVRLPRVESDPKLRQMLSIVSHQEPLVGATYSRISELQYVIDTMITLIPKIKLSEKTLIGGETYSYPYELLTALEPLQSRVALLRLAHDGLVHTSLRSDAVETLVELNIRN